MPPSLVTYGEKLPAARAGGPCRPDEPSAIVAATRAIAARNPAASRPRDLVFMGCASWILGEEGDEWAASFGTRGRCTQDWVVLAEDVVLRGARLVARVARGRG